MLSRLRSWILNGQQIWQTRPCGHAAMQVMLPRALSRPSSAPSTVQAQQGRCFEMFRIMSLLGRWPLCWPSVSLRQPCRQGCLDKQGANSPKLFPPDQVDHSPMRCLQTRPRQQAVPYEPPQSQDQCCRRPVGLQGNLVTQEHREISADKLPSSSSPKRPALRHTHTFEACDSPGSRFRGRVPMSRMPPSHQAAWEAGCRAGQSAPHARVPSLQAGH